MVRNNRVCVFLMSALAIFIAQGCKGRGANNSGIDRRAPVVVAAVERRTIPVQISAIGTVEAYATVEIKAQAGGLLSGVYFKEGQDVKKGDMLFSIDPRPYQAQLGQAEANLQRDSAQLDNAEVEAKRYEELFQKDLISREQYDQVRTNAEALRGTVMADKAVVQNAKLMLSYCYIRAPVSGRTGSLLAHTGDLIKADDVNSMVVINQIQPTYASFAVPELRLPEIKKYMAVAPLKVIAAVPGQNRPPEQGVMTFLDNAIDTATGTIKLKATFPNAEKTLWPGQFVNVTLELTELTNALVVPSQAVMTGQNGQYIYVVKPDMSAESRPVVAGQVFQNLTVVEKGIAAGETVVIDGQLQLVPGTKVEIKSPVAGAATSGSASGGVIVPGASASPPAGSGLDSK